MLLPFEKWHGCRNDFVVVWLSRNDESYVLPSLQRQAPQLCSKQGDGIGADGILVLHTETRRDLLPERLSVINRDGSLAANCGNGLRCAARSVYRRYQAAGPLHSDPLHSLTLKLDGHDMVCTFLPGHASEPLVAVAMGIPLVNEAVAWYAEAKSTVATLAHSLGEPALGADFYACELGNPHLVFFIERFKDGLLERVGPALQASPLADGMNVHLVVSRQASREERQQAQTAIGQSIDELHEALVWERGVGPTPACGSGACAIAAAALHSGLTPRQAWLGVAMPGGRLYVRQSAADTSIVLAGPASFVFEGQLPL